MRNFRQCSKLYESFFVPGFGDGGSSTTVSRHISMPTHFRRRAGNQYAKNLLLLSLTDQKCLAFYKAGKENRQKDNVERITDPPVKHHIGQAKYEIP